jgi:uncharacterized protein (TIGR03435 family)
MLARPVIDNTAVGGRLDALHLEYTPDLADPAQPPGPDEDAPALGTALREQIGLQLEAGKGPVDVLVIDHVEKPSVN